jgi:hypothetical protein
MPGDITGSEILDDHKNFKFSKGPLFANIILADEINRTPPKTQAALLEAMQEKTVTVGGQNHLLPQSVFSCIASNKAAWVLGGVLFISSAKNNIGKQRTFRKFKIFVIIQNFGAGNISGH